MYKAEPGMVWDYATPREDGVHLYNSILYLGKNDSIDNYKQVSVEERDTLLAKQEKEEKEIELSRILRQLYPEEYKEG